MRSYSPEPPRNQDNSWLGRVFLVAGILFLLGMLLVFGGCSPRIYERIVVQHDTTRVVVRDSVRFYDRDSIFIKEKGDTIYQYVEKWRWRDRVRIDTFYRVRVDSVAVVHTEVVKVEQPLSWWRKFKLASFWYLCGAVLLLLAWCTRKWWLKLIKIV